MSASYDWDSFFADDNRVLFTAPESVYNDVVKPFRDSAGLYMIWMSSSFGDIGLWEVNFDENTVFTEADYDAVAKYSKPWLITNPVLPEPDPLPDPILDPVPDPILDPILDPEPEPDPIIEYSPEPEPDPIVGYIPERRRRRRERERDPIIGDPDLRPRRPRRRSRSRYSSIQDMFFSRYRF